jgi:hypothetical protein
VIYVILLTTGTSIWSIKTNRSWPNTASAWAIITSNSKTPHTVHKIQIHGPDDQEASEIELHPYNMNRKQVMETPHSLPQKDV